MSKLFELYVLGKLRQRYGQYVQYQFAADKGNYLDYLVDHPERKMVVDAKYKLYDNEKVSIQDIRQIAGYARHEKVYEKLDLKGNELIDCLIIYPSGVDELPHELDSAEWDKLFENSNYRQLWKLGISLPPV